MPLHGMKGLTLPCVCRLSGVIYCHAEIKQSLICLLYPSPLYRPGVIDLPSAARGDNPDALVLPEVFHDFEDTIADMGYMSQ